MRSASITMSCRSGSFWRNTNDTWQVSIDRQIVDLHLILTRCADLVCPGRSPHARGKLRAPVRWNLARRSIPACTGETTAPLIRPKHRQVDPRMHGGNGVTPVWCHLAQGRSPHARGKQLREADQVEQDGSIPACTGETRYLPFTHAFCWVDPRMHGGNRRTRLDWCGLPGRSPHARGKQSKRRALLSRRRSIPACTGETR